MSERDYPIKLKELKDYIDQIYSRYGDTDVLLEDPDGGEPFVLKNAGASLFGNECLGLWIEIERKEKKE